MCPVLFVLCAIIWGIPLLLMPGISGDPLWYHGTWLIGYIVGCGMATITAFAIAFSAFMGTQFVCGGLSKVRRCPRCKRMHPCVDELSREEKLKQLRESREETVRYSRRWAKRASDIDERIAELSDVSEDSDVDVSDESD